MDWLVSPLSSKGLLWFAVFSCHFLGDFPLQGDFLAVGKKNSFELLLYHVFVHTASFLLLFLVPYIMVTYAAIIILFVSHGVIDYLKIKFWPEKIWLDQLLHAVVYVSILRGEFITTSMYA